MVVVPKMIDTALVPKITSGSLRIKDVMATPMVDRITTLYTDSPVDERGELGFSMLQ